MTSKRPRSFIFDELARPDSCEYRSPAHPASPMLWWMREMIQESVRVVIDEPAAWYWQSPVDTWGRDMFGPARMPFPMMWFEWTMPDTLHAEGRIQQWSGPRDWAALLYGADLPDLAGRMKPELLEDLGEGAVSVINRITFVRDGGAIVRVPLVDVTGLGSDGRITSVNTPSSYIPVTTPDEKIPAEINAYVPPGWDLPLSELMAMNTDHFKSVLLGLSLMNCKNVQVNHTVPGPVRYKKSRRVRAPGLDYHVIQLPRAASSSTADRVAAVGGGVALHKVRGHVATYTDDAKLFGKHVGTYWVPWHTRGTADLGTIVSSYRVGSPK